MLFCLLVVVNWIEGDCQVDAVRVTKLGKFKMVGLTELSQVENLICDLPTRLQKRNFAMFFVRFDAGVAKG